MPVSGGIRQLLDGLVEESLGDRAADREKQAGGILEALVTGRDKQRAALREIRRSGDIDEILDAERAILAAELERAANTSDKVSSLTNSLIEIEAAKAMLPIVRDPEKYLDIDSVILNLPKNRKGALPNDQARQFFDSQQSRIRDLRKGRVDEDEERVLNVRHSNMTGARRLYMELQERALGIARPSRSRGPDLER